MNAWSFHVKMSGHTFRSRHVSCIVNSLYNLRISNCQSFQASVTLLHYCITAAWHRMTWASRQENISKITVYVLMLSVGTLFYDAFSVTRLYTVDDRVMSERWWVGKDLVGSGRGLILGYYPVIRLEGLRKTTKISIRIAGHRGREFNPGPPECVSGVLTTRPRRSVFKTVKSQLLHWRFFGVKLTSSEIWRVWRFVTAASMKMTVFWGCFAL
jgi:hypothetical protein